MDDIIKRFFDNLDSEIIYEKEFSRISRIHKYWSRKPWYIIEKYIRQYSQEGDLVLDPFCGSCSTGLEAILKNRSFIGTDLNPMSILVGKGTLDSNVNLEDLKKDFLKIENLCKDKILDLYKYDEKCNKCESMKAFKYIGIGPSFDELLPCQIYCPYCSGKRNGFKTDVTRTKYLELYPTDSTLNDMDFWVPDKEFPKDFYKDRFSYKGISKVSDFYTSRNLAALSFTLNSIKSIESKYEHLLILAFTNTVLHSSHLKGMNVRPLGVNNYWIPDDYMEENVWFRFEDRFNQMLKSKETLFRRIDNDDTLLSEIDYNIFKESALDLDLDRQVDYIFTDPPYGDAIQYSELSFVWNAWIDEDYDIEEEVIINPKQNKGTVEFKSLLDSSLYKINELLKDGGYFTLCFQNKDSKIWTDVIDTCKNLKLSLYDIQIYDTFGHSYNKGWAKFSPKADIYVTFKKEKAPIENFFSDSIDLELLIEDILNYMCDENMDIDVVKLYDVTISLLIWNYFYNDKMNSIESFTIKDFQETIDDFFKNKNYEKMLNSDKDQITFNI